MHSLAANLRGSPWDDGRHTAHPTLKCSDPILTGHNRNGAFLSKRRRAATPEPQRMTAGPVRWPRTNGILAWLDFQCL